jgi:hypothetical protein
MEAKAEAKKEMVVIPPENYLLRGNAIRSGIDWTVHLPAGLKEGDFPVGQVVRSPFGGAPRDKEIERNDKLTLVAGDDTFIVECVAVEPTPLGLAVLVREVVKMPPRVQLGDARLPENVRVRQAGGDLGLVIERKNKDGSWHQVTSEKMNPSWHGRPDLAREHAKDYARTIA